MAFRILVAVIGLAIMPALAARGQSTSSSPSSTARVETAAIELTLPDKYQIPVVFEPNRKVTVMAPADGILRAFSVPIGATVRELAEIGQLDRTEASARVKVAEAVVKEMEAALAEVKARAPKSKPLVDQAEARLEAAKARAELEQVALDRCTFRAPFSGRVMAILVSPGQYVPKGGAVAELADVSSLRALIPVDRTAVSAGSDLSLTIEGKSVTGKVQAVLPLPETLAPLRELAAPLGSAWVSVPNAKGSLEPGQRVLSPAVPTGPLAMVATRAVREDAEASTGSSVQVVRNEFVADVPVRVLGSAGDERSQVSGPFRPNDVLIVSSSVPLLAGTLIRFNGNPSAGGAVEGQGPRPGEVGEVAGITPPTRTPGVAPIGAPGSAVPKTSSRTTSRPTTTRPSSGSGRPTNPSRPAPTGGSTIPF